MGTYLLSAANNSSFRIEIQTDVKPNTLSGVGSIVAVGIRFGTDTLIFGLDFINSDRSTARLNGVPIIANTISPSGTVQCYQLQLKFFNKV
jgi:hypothetical protein